MQDMIENRRKVGLDSKMQLALMSVRDNGILWFIFVSIYFIGSIMARFGLEKADALRRKKNLPGINSATANKFVWENWDWSGKGDEWTISPEWKDSVVRNFIAPHFNQCGTVVEIGPGAGRWTEFLVTKAGSLIGIVPKRASTNAGNVSLSSPMLGLKPEMAGILRRLRRTPSMEFGLLTYLSI